MGDLVRAIEAAACGQTAILYDGDCPLCRNTALYLRLREQVGPVKIVNLREHPALVERLRQARLDPDEGMVFLHDGRVFHGAAAMSELARLASEGDAFGRLTRRMFGSPLVARALYPVLRLARRIALLATGHRQFSR